MRVGTPKFQAAHGFRRGQPVVRSGNRYVLATEALGFTGVVGTIYSLDQFELITSGELDNVPSLVQVGDNSAWYLTNVPGVLSTTGTTRVGRIIGKNFLVQPVASTGGTSGGSTTINNITQGPELSDLVPRPVSFGVPANPGSSEEAARADHRHDLELPPNVFSGEVLGLTNYDPKTGMMRHVKLAFNSGFATTPTYGPWHPYHESLDAAQNTVTPSAGTPPPTGAHTYRHISNALSYIADDDNMALTPRFLTPLTCTSENSASVAVAANAGNTWFGSVLPITFTNNATTPRKYCVQVHTPMTLPTDHYVSMGIGNIPECECQWLAEMPQVFSSVEDVQPDGGTITIWLFLGLGISSGGELAIPSKTAYTIQVDVWFQ